MQMKIFLGVNVGLTQEREGLVVCIFQLSHHESAYRNIILYTNFFIHEAYSMHAAGPPDKH